MSLRNRKLIGWKIWYGDGTVLDSRFNKWTQCKQFDVQVIAMFYESDNGIEKNLHFNQEYYLLDSLLQIPREIKLGRAIEGQKFYDIKAKAENDITVIDTMLDNDRSSPIC